MPRLLVLLAFALAGCAPFDGRPALTPSLADAQRAVTAVDLSERTATALVAKQGGAYEHGAAEALVQETLAHLVRAASADDLRVGVTLLNSPGYNAFSLPDGRIFLSRGMLALASDQAELAAALAHELGHVLSKHVAARIVERARARADAEDVARNVGDDEVTRATILSHRLSLAAFSRNQELEADRVSIDLLRKAGYDPRASLRLLQSLERMTGLALRRAGERRPEANPVATHPPNPERIAALREALKSLPPVAGKTGRERYLQAIAGVTFGEDGAGGFVRGAHFIDPARDFAMNLPDSWRMFAGASGFGALKKGGRAVAIISLARAGVAADPEGALRRLVAAAGADAPLVPLPEGGPPGFVAAFEKDQTSLRVAMVTRGEHAWRLVFSATPGGPDFDTEVARALASVRAPDARDRALARPLALRVAKVDGPAALRRLAASAGDAAGIEETLLALNGLASARAARPGAVLKVADFARP